jgi:hypothetical protein
MIAAYRSLKIAKIVGQAANLGPIDLLNMHIVVFPLLRSF